MRVWPGANLLILFWIKFQLTHPWGCDSTTGISQSGSRPFQLTHPWGCDMLMLTDINQVNDFNSHTREGVTAWVSLMPQYIAISTHTPVRVWRHSNTMFVVPSTISTHTPVRVWRSLKFVISICLEFQLTHPWGCDSSIGKINRSHSFQLTHPWGCDLQEA